MPGPGFDVRDTLRLELQFLELGLYRGPTPSLPLLVFEDSPTCPRYGSAACPNCALMQFVPSERRSELVPCRHIPLNDAGETVDSLYRTGTQEELEEAVRNWLAATIKRAEEKQIQAGDRASLERPDRTSAP